MTSITDEQKQRLLTFSDSLTEVIEQASVQRDSILRRLRQFADSETKMFDPDAVAPITDFGDKFANNAGPLLMYATLLQMETENTSSPENIVQLLDEMVVMRHQQTDKPHVLEQQAGKKLSEEALRRPQATLHAGDNLRAFVDKHLDEIPAEQRDILVGEITTFQLSMNAIFFDALDKAEALSKEITTSLKENAPREGQYVTRYKRDPDGTDRQR